MRIAVLTRYGPLGSSSRVRFYQYLPALQAAGIEYVITPFFTDDYVRDLYAGRRASAAAVLQAYGQRLSALRRARSFDFLWVEKELLPWVPHSLERLFHTTPYVVDYDDAVFHHYDMHRSALVRAALGRKIDGVMRRAALVIAGNDYLAERARRAGAPLVERLPSVVDVRQYALTEEAESQVFRIGWIGSPVTAPYLGLVREPLDVLQRESPVSLTLIGAGSIPPLPGIQVNQLAWNESIERGMSGKFDVGIMPLVDGPFERGKCGYKLIQYMASGLPVVASPVGVNQQIVDPGVNGHLASSSEEWLSALRELRDHAEQRKLMGQAGRRKAEQKYNLQGTAPRLLELFAGLTKR